MADVTINPAAEAEAIATAKAFLRGKGFFVGKTTRVGAVAFIGAASILRDETQARELAEHKIALRVGREILKLLGPEAIKQDGKGEQIALRIGVEIATGENQNGR